MRINSVEELDEVIAQDFKPNTQKWARVIGFYNRVRWRGAHDVHDHLKTITSLSQSLRKQGYELTVKAVRQLINLYEEQLAKEGLEAEK